MANQDWHGKQKPGGPPGPGPQPGGPGGPPGPPGPPGGPIPALALPLNYRRSQKDANNEIQIIDVSSYSQSIIYHSAVSHQLLINFQFLHLVINVIIMYPTT